MELLRIEPSGKWIRGMIGGQVVIDSTEAKLGWEHRYYPWWDSTGRSVQLTVASP